MTKFTFMIIVLVFLAFCNTVSASRTNFEVRRFEVCNNTQGIIKWYGNFVKEKGQYYLNYNVTSPVEWGDNLGSTCLIESRVMGQFVELFTIREKNICKASNIYLGEFWYEIARAARITPGVCPIPPGRYHVNHLLIDFNKISLQTFPFGRLRFTISAVDNRNKNNYMWCMLLEVENVVN